MTVSAVNNANETYNYNASTEKTASKPEVEIKLNGDKNKASEQNKEKEVTLQREINYANEKIKKSKESKNAKEKAEAAKISVDKKTGHIILELKKDMSVEDLKKMFNIPDGILKHYNDIPYAEKAGGKDEDHHVRDYTGASFHNGKKVIVPNSSFESDGWFKELIREVARGI